MKLNFKDFFHLIEIDIDSIDTDQMQFKKVGDGYTYTFNMDGDDYIVKFYRYPISVPGDYYGDTITRNAYEIILSGPSGTSPTGKGKPMTVYRNLLGACKKLMQVANPEGLHFFGAYPEQDIMYAQFYNKYLKSVFTQISHEDYLRNDVLERIKQTEPDWWDKIEKSMQQHAQDNPVEQMRQEKLEKRNKLLALASQMKDAIGKVLWNPSEGQCALVTAINGITASCFGTTYSSGSGSSQPKDYKVSLDQLRSFKNLSSYYQGYLQQFLTALTTLGKPQAQPYMGEDFESVQNQPQTSSRPAGWSTV